MSDFIVVYEVATRRGNSDPVIWSVEMDLHLTGSDNCIGKDLQEILNKYLAAENWQLIKLLSIKIEKKCWGCRNDRPGQSDHMEVGGCLYAPSQQPSRQGSANYSREPSEEF